MSRTPELSGKNFEENGKFGTTDVFMLLTVLVWGANFSVVKIALREFPPLAFNGVRLFSASLFLWVILLARREKILPERRDLGKIILLSFLGNSVYQILFIKGISLTTASNTALVMASTPVLIALLSSYFAKERLPWAGWAGIIMSFGGLYLVITQRAGALALSREYLAGDAMILAGNLCWAVYTVFSRPLLVKYSPLRLAAMTLPAGTLMYLPFAAGELADLRWPEISPIAWASLVYSAILAIGLGFIIWYASLRRVGNSRTGIYGNITPVVAVLVAHFFLGERITAFQVLGAGVIFAGFYLARSGYRLNEKRRLSKPDL